MEKNENMIALRNKLANFFKLIMYLFNKVLDGILISIVSIFEIIGLITMFFATFI